MNKVVELDTNKLSQLVLDALEDIKAQDIRMLDVESVSTFTDRMIIASGSTSRQVKALATNVIEKAKQAHVSILGTEGENPGEWILIDLGDVVVHIMVPQIRDFYNLEKLWTVENNEAGQNGSQGS